MNRLAAFLIGTLTLSLFPGCRKEVSPINTLYSPMQRNDTYTIPEGENYSTPRRYAEMGTGTTLHFAARLRANTAPVNESEIASYNHVSKLFGFTDCRALDPQTNSARVGWIFHETVPLANDPRPLRKIGDKTYVMDVLPYIDQSADLAHPHQYDTGNPLAAIELDRFYTYSIQIQADRYAFTISDDTGQLLNTQTVPRHCPEYLGNKSILFPYFGGTATAPHSMDIDVNLLD